MQGAECDYSSVHGRCVIGARGRTLSRGRCAGCSDKHISVAVKVINSRVRQSYCSALYAVGRAPPLCAPRACTY